MSRRVLMVSPDLPVPPTSGMRIRVWDLLLEFHERGIPVTLVALTESPPTPKETATLAEIGVELIPVSPLGGWRESLVRLGLRLWDRFGPPPLANPLLCPPALVRAVRTAAERQAFDLLWVHFAFLAPCLDAAGRIPVSVMDTHDILQQKYESFAAIGRARHLTPFNNLRRELAALRRFDRIVAITPEDAAFFQDRLPRAIVAAIPVSYRPFPPLPPGPLAVQGPVVLFVGGDDEGTVDAITGFYRSGWPAVRAAHPGARLRIVGAVNSRLTGLETEDLERIGTTAALPSHYRDARVVIVPYRTGSGLKIKMLEALSYGRSVVATPVSLRGIPARAGTELLVGETWEDLGKETARLLADEDLRERLGRQARAFMERLFAPEVVYAPLDAITSPPPPHGRTMCS